MALIPGDGEWEGGDGEFEEERGLIIEQTSDFPGHYEVMALVQEVAGMKELIQLSMEASRELQLEAQAVLAAHAESAQDYLRQAEEHPVPDFYPFLSMPAGTSVRDLPGGGRIFSLADGSFVRVSSDGTMVAVAVDGDIMPLQVEGGTVTLPDGPELSVNPTALRATHEVAGIAGLPVDLEPMLVADKRYRVELPGDYRLDVFQSDRTALISNPAGTMIVLGLSRIEGIGEEVKIHFIPHGGKGFAAAESGHRGVIEPDSTIRLAMANGLDLVIRFPDSSLENDQVAKSENLFTCEARQP